MTPIDLRSLGQRSRWSKIVKWFSDDNSRTHTPRIMKLHSSACFCLISSQAGQMVGSTIGPSCLTIFSLLPPSLPSQAGHRSVLSYTLLPVSAFSPSQACQMVGSTIGPSCLPLSLLFLPSLLPSGPDGWFYHRSVLSYTLLPVSAFSPSQAGQMVVPVSALSPPKRARWLVLPFCKPWWCFLH